VRQQSLRFPGLVVGEKLAVELWIDVTPIIVWLWRRLHAGALWNGSSLEILACNHETPWLSSLVYTIRILFTFNYDLSRDCVVLSTFHWWMLEVSLCDYLIRFVKYHWSMEVGSYHQTAPQHCILPSANVGVTRCLELWKRENNKKEVSKRSHIHIFSIDIFLKKKYFKN